MNALRHVLILDDDDISATLMRMSLHRIDRCIQVATVATVATALQHLRTANASFPSLLVVDLQLVGETGFDFLDRYQQDFAPHHPDTCVWVCSSSVRLSDRRRSEGYDCVQAYVDKATVDDRLGTLLRDHGLQVPPETAPATS